MQFEIQIKPPQQWKSLLSPWACYKKADHKEMDGKKRDEKEVEGQ